MPGRRTCRVCGCWQLRACPGGCAWASADRCSACPSDAPAVIPINAAHLAAATLRERIRYAWNAVDGDRVERVMQQAAEFPNLLLMTTLRAGEVIRREIYVGALEVPDADLAIAAELLNERRLAA